MKSLLTKIISALTILTMCASLCACDTEPLNNNEPENCDNGHNLVQSSYTAPTCKTNGQRVSKCSRCEYTETENLLPIDHSYQIIASTPSTCSTHGSQTVKCSMCYIEMTNQLPLLDHNYELTDETPSTCTIKGVKNYECQDCQDTYSQELELLRHDYKTVNTATCFEDGELKNVCNDCQHEEVIEEVDMFTHDFGIDGYCTKCGVFETLIDEADLSVTSKRYYPSAGTTGAMVSTPAVSVRGNLTQKFNNDNTIPYTYFETHPISLTLTFYDDSGEVVRSLTVQSTINPYQGNYQYTMTLQYGGFQNGLANQFRLDVVDNKLDDATTFKIELSCERYKTITRIYNLPEIQ